MGSSLYNSCTIPAAAMFGGNITNDPVFVDLAVGDFHLQPASPCINVGDNRYATNAMDLDGNPRIIAGIVDMGTYEFQSPIRYVDVNSTNATPPYTNWATAANVIQDAVDAAGPGDLVLVTNGVYATGGRRWYDSGTNRVTLTNAVTLQSVNGPAVTLIVGSHVAGTGQALTNAVRCVAIGDTAVLSGFTLTNGESGWGNYPNGGGVSQVLSVFAAGTVTNCVLVGNLSTNGAGGGAYRVRLLNCQITRNYAPTGGGACSCTLVNCTVVSNTATSGGGVYGGSVYGPSLLSHCTIIGNAAQNGGGIYGATATNCLIINNTAASSGGGSCQGTFVNCTIAGNMAVSLGGGVYGGSGAWLYNSVIYYNLASAGLNLSGSKSDNCCSTPPMFGNRNITDLPAFVDVAGGDYRLQSNSPCINAGNNSSVYTATDLDGNPRIVGGTLDIGAYEFQSPQSVISYAWLQHYGLPTDGSADYANNDTDPHNNWQEWKADTDPTNSESFLELMSPVASPSGVSVQWRSTNSRFYFLDRATDLAAQPPFSNIASNIFGQAGTTIYSDTTATNTGPFFYRVGVQE